jgi:hypothetical protein
MLDGLFSDLTDQPLRTAIEPTSSETLAPLCNAEPIAQLLARALRVRFVARGKVRTVIGHAKRLALLCQVTPGAPEDDASPGSSRRWSV